MRVVVLGGGSTGEHSVGALRRLDDGVELTLVENRLVGAECSYWACMPTKTMLRAAERAHCGCHVELRRGDVEPVEHWSTWYVEYLLGLR